MVRPRSDSWTTTGCSIKSRVSEKGEPGPVKMCTRRVLKHVINLPGERGRGMRDTRRGLRVRGFCGERTTKLVSLFLGILMKTIVPVTTTLLRLRKDPEWTQTQTSHITLSQKEDPKTDGISYLILYSSFSVWVGHPVRN